MSCTAFLPKFKMVWKRHSQKQLCSKVTYLPNNQFRGLGCSIVEWSLHQCCKEKWVFTCSFWTCQSDRVVNPIEFVLNISLMLWVDCLQTSWSSQVCFHFRLSIVILGRNKLGQVVAKFWWYFFAFFSFHKGLRTRGPSTWCPNAVLQDKQA